jgi:glutathione S-transferase
MLKLYHFPGAICAQKVRVCLAEKQVRWESKDVLFELRSPDYLAINPAGNVPVLDHDGRIIRESRVINEYIDETFPGPTLQPKDNYSRARMRLWSKQLDESLFPCIYILSFVALFRDQFLMMPADMRERLMPYDFTKRERTVHLLERGWESPYIAIALKRFETFFADTELALSQSPWLSGDFYTLADIDHTPYLQRLADLGLAWMWADHPATADWIERIRMRPSFSAVLKDWIPTDAQERSKENAPIFTEKFKTVRNS